MTDQLTALFTLEHFRAVNLALAVLTSCGVLYRTPDALLGVTSKRLYVVLALFPVAVGGGTVQAFYLHAPTGPMTLVFTGLYIALAIVVIWWPPQLVGRHQRAEQQLSDR